MDEGWTDKLKEQVRPVCVCVCVCVCVDSACDRILHTCVSRCVHDVILLSCYRLTKAARLVATWKSVKLLAISILLLARASSLTRSMVSVVHTLNVMGVKENIKYQTASIIRHDHEVCITNSYFSHQRVVLVT